jgi:hypothetical protein
LLRLSPPHGWRAVWWELAIVTLGVLIALAAQQFAERASSKERAAQAHKRIKSEINYNQGIQVERVAIRACLSDRLRELSSGIVSGRSHWAGAVIPKSTENPDRAFASMYRVPTRPWATDGYDEALVQGDLKHASFEERAGLVQVYTQIKYSSALNEEEQRLRAELAPLQFDPVLSTPEKNRLLATIARLDQINSLLVTISRQTFKNYRALGFADTPEEIAEFHRTRSWEKLVEDYRKNYGACVDARAVADIDPSLLPIAWR